MDKFKGTPGPWEVPSECIYDQWMNLQKTLIKGNGEFSFVAQSVGNTTEECNANARLIAAAPDLLDALQELVDLMEDVRTGDYIPDTFTTQPALLAIKKALGNH